MACDREARPPVRPVSRGEGGRRRPATRAARCAARPPQPGERIEALVDKHLEAEVEAGLRSLHELGVSQVRLEPQAVGGAARDTDADAGRVDVGESAQRRPRAHQERRLDLAVRLRERDRRRALRLSADQPHVPFFGLGGIGEEAGVGVWDHL
jgi:hypothetical protein